MDSERLPAPPLWLFSAAAIPVYLASMLVLLGGLALLVATPLWEVRVISLIGIAVAVAAFQLPFLESAARAHAERASLWVHQARYHLAHDPNPSRWTPSGREMSIRRRLLFVAAAWAFLMTLVAFGVWVGDRMGASDAFRWSALCLLLAALPAVAVYLWFERRWARRAAIP